VPSVVPKSSSTEFNKKRRSEMIEFMDEDVQQYVANLKVIGVGGGGCNAVNRMVTADLKGVEFISANTDYKSLKKNMAGKKLQLGKKLTKGLGSGGDPGVGREAALESADEIQEAVQGADMVFVAAGLGGGTGTGSAPVVAEIVKKMGILTVAVVTRPFEFEGPVRKAQAEDGLQAILPHVDAIIVVPNERLNIVSEANTDFFNAFRRVDEVLVQAVEGITGVIHSEGFINRDFADVKRILTAKGKALMGSGYGTGEDRALKAVQQAVACPLLEDVDIAGADAVLVQITAGANFSMNEFQQINGFIQKAARQGAEIVPGVVRDENLHDGLRVTLIATGFGKVPAKNVEEDSIKTFKDFVLQKFEPSKVAAGAGFEKEEAGSELTADFGSGQYDIPAYLRRRLTHKGLNN
jgi:cell division protein FtsZ